MKNQAEVKVTPLINEPQLLREMFSKQEARQMLDEKLIEWEAVKQKIIDEELDPIFKRIDKIQDSFSKWFWFTALKMLFLPKPYREAIRHISRLKRLRALSSNSSKSQAFANFGHKLQLAREVPISTLHHFERLKRTGSRSVSLCPFHNEKTPSFTLYPDNSFHCFSCGAHGRDSVDFFRLLNGVDFKTAVTALAGGVL